jgi:hypothetical protein
MSEWAGWLVDASFPPRDGFWTFVPFRRVPGEGMIVYWGVAMIASVPPENAPLVGVIHPESDAECEAFCQAHETALDELKRQTQRPHAL